MTDKIILFSYDKPEQYLSLLNDEAGIWSWTLTPNLVKVEDDYGNTGYYTDTNAKLWQVFSVKVDGTDYNQVNTMSDLRLADGSWLYDATTSKIKIHFANFDPPLGKTILIGFGFGYANKSTSDNLSYYNDYVYEERLSAISTIKKSIDPLFFGMLKYQPTKVTLLNNDGKFDTWRDLNLYGQSTRVLFGNNGDAYDKFVRMQSGFIENDSRDWDNIQVNIQDVRKSLSQPVANNTLSKATYPNISPETENAIVPVCYGNVTNATAICVNGEESGSPNYVFKFMDTTFNQPHSVTVYVDRETNKTAAPTVNVNLINGTFTLLNSIAKDKLDSVTCDITTSISNGVEIIKDLIKNYDNKIFINSFWDTEEVNDAVLLARNTSLYIDDKSTQLIKAIESVCFDCDARFFLHDWGTYTVRIYDANRLPSRIIYDDEWTDEPSIDDTASEYLSSCTIKYNKDVSSNEFTRQIEDTSFQTVAYNRYKKLKSDTFETNLTTEADALDKSATIMAYSSNVSDIINRSIKLVDNELELCDFVICDPSLRYDAIPNWGMYEVISLEKNLMTETIKLSLRFVSLVDYDTFPFLTDEQYYRTTGRPSTGITTVSDNIRDGLTVKGFEKLGSFLYGADKFQLSASYVGYKYKSNRIKFSTSGTVYYSYRKSTDKKIWTAWTDWTLAEHSENIIKNNLVYIQLRAIFKPVLYADDTKLIIQEVK